MALIRFPLTWTTTGTSTSRLARLTASFSCSAGRILEQLDTLVPLHTVTLVLTLHYTILSWLHRLALHRRTAQPSHRYGCSRKNPPVCPSTARIKRATHMPGKPIQRCIHAPEPARLPRYQLFVHLSWGARNHSLVLTYIPPQVLDHGRVSRASGPARMREA